MTLPLDYRFDYAHDDRARAAFREFLVDIHGLDLALWEEKVGFDPRFVSFSFFEGDRVVASTSVYSIDMMLDGAWAKVAQISSVGTREEYRLRGLNADLTHRALEWTQSQGHAGTFLFSDADAVGFYRKLGFAEIPEWIHRAPVRTAPRGGARRLDYHADEALIRRLVESRVPVSRRVGVRSPKLEFFHLLYENAGEMRYLEDFDLMACVEQEDGRLKVYDLIGPKLPNWADVEGQLIDDETLQIEFWITPDRLDLDEAETFEVRSSCLHVRPEERLFDGQFVVPWTAHA